MTIRAASLISCSRGIGYLQADAEGLLCNIPPRVKRPGIAGYGPGAGQWRARRNRTRMPAETGLTEESDGRGLGQTEQRPGAPAEIALVCVRDEIVREPSGNGGDPAHSPAAIDPHPRPDRRP